MTRITIIQGHPTSDLRHFCHALADAYAQGAAEGGHEVRVVPVADLDFPLLRSKSDWEGALPPPAIAEAQQALAWAEHVLIIYPLWLGGMPALLKGFMEQAFRPAFMTGGTAGASWKTALKGRSSRIVITMGMPAFAYRWYFGAYSLRSLKRSILALVGIGPNRHTLVGMIEGMSEAKRRAWLAAVRKLGARAR
ncbi:NAD(P)H-dependent oxidoreductase [Microvirga arsenatis]|uniref:Flavodoxin family protein n=1 Tax=Microvirga arsenatis TaxID=2692265 RepID=A0ABW9Z888_9HYPH|nr:NAD(P)H-dependent oxidoreductase [Microvirga arsenatis]NBJ13103.1 flavodoxin family protein [Microvirga arsenatis]NBJ26854.1 flavodoxin family protein [Microvirga arsenatis]